jgi:hypothetical protein
VVIPDVAHLRSPASLNPAPSLDIPSCRTFRYEDLFEIVRGEVTPSIEIKPGDVPLVRSTERSNGITGFVDLPTRVHPARERRSVARSLSSGVS